MADLRAIIGGELTRQSRGVVRGLLRAAAGATFLNVWGMVVLRRKDFGRRRALGATRLMIVMLVVLQVLVVAVVGAVLGVASGSVWLSLHSQPRPSLSYLSALCTGLVAAASLAAALPAGFAAQRDPIAELRVP